ncbi:MAG: hypothetical protein LBB15_01615 [Puniceicoccales bacterium]|jgi:dihydrofolate synthase/folylpolyglutamate synthase|nr:hypothetical protein [Puniceicoccales bacterium]
MCKANYGQIVRKLFAKRTDVGCKFGEFRDFAEKFLPKSSSRVIHVAGTNGKGSVCALLDAAYRAAGYATGLFTSPHLLEMRERIRYNGELISEENFCRIFSEIEKRHHLNLSFFQYLTLIALAYFFERAAGVIILECGIGGRLDSTNIVRTDASIITSIAFDHEEILGETLESIAQEKSGIIKPGAKVFVGDIPKCTEVVVRRIAQENLANLVKINGADQFFESNLNGDCQRNNAKLACTALKNLRDILPIEDGAIGRGFANVFWPARNQVVSLKNGNKLIFDGAHNVEAVCSQRDYILRTVSGNSTTLIFSSTKTRQCKFCFAILEPLFHRVLVTNISDGNKKLPDDVFIELADTRASKCRFLNLKACAELLVRPTDEVYFVTGSLLLIGELADSLVTGGQLDSGCFLAPSG